MEDVSDWGCFLSVAYGVPYVRSRSSGERGQIMKRRINISWSALDGECFYDINYGGNLLKGGRCAYYG